MFEELAEGVWRRRYDLLSFNVGIVAGDDGVLLVDTRASHRQADALWDELRHLTPKPVRWVVNTHWHWDHTFGNAVFDEARLFGHRRCRHRLLTEGEAARADALRWLGEEAGEEINEVVVTPPEELIDDAVRIDLGSRYVEVRHLGLGHTDNDVVVTVSDAPVAFAGDLLEDGSEPIFGDSYPLRWPDTVAALRGLEAAVWVPGHGDVMDEAAVVSQHEMLTEVARRCGDALATNVFDPHAGPYSPPTMAVAWERAKTEASADGEGGHPPARG